MSFAPPPPSSLLPPPPPLDAALPPPPPPPMLGQHFLPPPPPPVGVGNRTLLPPAVGGVPPPGPSRASTSFQILMTNLPKHLHNNRNLREWLGSAVGGGVRNVLFAPAAPRLYHNDVTAATTKNKDGETPASSIVTPNSASALITMSNADAALKVIASFRHCKKKLLEQQDATAITINAHAVPVHPDIPLPPPILDPVTTQVLGDKLYQAYLTILQQSHELENMDPSSSHYKERNSSITRNKDDLQPNETDNTNNKNSDEYYDNEEDEDPLTSPAVLEAVQRFRQNLEKLQGSKATRRKALVQSKLLAALPVVREKMKAQKQRQQPQPAPPPLPVPINLPVPIPSDAPLPPPPPPGALLPTPQPPRGVSNLPAWMTQQQQHASGEETDQVEAKQEPAPKRIKTTSNVWSESSIFPVLSSSDQYDLLRNYIREQIKHFLGEEELTLIEFIYNHILQQKPVSTLLPELEQVLDVDGKILLQSLWEKVNEL